MRALLAASVLTLLAGCGGGDRERAEAATHGDARRGRDAIQRRGCGSCHTIPGIPGAHALVGPPLEHVASRAYVAGQIPNEPAGLIAWIRDPQGHRFPNAMPNMAIPEDEARDIAAYLYTLR